MLGFPGATPSKDRIADWLEARVIFAGNQTFALPELIDEIEEDGTVIDLAAYDTIVDPALGVSDPDDAYRSARDDQAEGAGQPTLLAEDAFLEIQYRREVVGPNYPLTVDGDLIARVVPAWEDAPLYAFLIGLNARAFHGLTANIQTAARLFERVVVYALANYWCGESAHFGWPRDQSDPTAFAQALEELVRRMGERLNRTPDQIPARLKDMSLDAVAWRPLDDRRGQTVLLCQCATGTDWDQKGLHVTEWERLVTFAVTPTPALAFPFVPSAVRDFTDVEWELLCGRVGLPLDRLRIAQLVDQGDLAPDLVEGMRDWIAPLMPALAATN